MSTFFVPQTPVTSTPNDLAICTANVPTPNPRTVNQHLVPRLNPPLIAKTLQVGERRHWHRSGFLERQLFRLPDQGRLGSARILGKGSAARAENRVARLEPGHVPAHHFHLAGHVMTEPMGSGRARAGRIAREEAGRSHQAPVGRIDGGRANFNQNFDVLRTGFPRP
jgi:hypothetical protein